MAINDELYDAIVFGERETVVRIVKDAVARGDDVGLLLNETMIPALREVGEQFSRHEVYVPEMLIAARAMQGGMDIIEPLLTGASHQPLAKVCIGSVKGDLHDIGKNLVVMMLKGNGFDVEDLGVDCRIEKFDAAVDRGARVVCLSALLSTTREEMRPVIRHFRERGGVKVVVGGAAVTSEFAAEIGADAFGVDAADAARVVRACLGMTAGA